MTVIPSTAVRSATTDRGSACRGYPSADSAPKYARSSRCRTPAADNVAPSLTISRDFLDSKVGSHT